MQTQRKCRRILLKTDAIVRFCERQYHFTLKLVLQLVIIVRDPPSLSLNCVSEYKVAITGISVNMKELISMNKKQVTEIHRNNLTYNAKKTLKTGWQVCRQSNNIFLFCLTTNFICFYPSRSTLTVVS